MDRRNFLAGLFAGAALAGTMAAASGAEAQRWSPASRGGWKQEVIQGMNRRARMRDMPPMQRRRMMMRRRRMMRQRFMAMRGRGSY